VTETTFEQPEPDDRARFDPEPWETLGISKHDGLAWWKHRIAPGDALRWRRAGVSEPIDAVRWKIAGVSPDTVREWVYAKIDAREAVGWTELGFTVAEARKHKRAGRTPVEAYGRAHRRHAPPPHSASPPPHSGSPPPHSASPPPARAYARMVPGPMARPGGAAMHRFMEVVRQRDPTVIHSYMQRQWFDDEAIAWAVHGIEAGEALAWKELGLTPVEAERQRAHGMNAMQTAKAWWRAGIPFDEVADWIGAGLTPTEAAAQRARGITVERAAVLRSLRKDH
jgi:hypothetical protein